MKKLLKILIVLLLIVLIAIVGLVFTQQGNDVLKPYLKTELEKQIGLPVKIDLFVLRYDNITFDFIINDTLKIQLKSIFNLLTQAFDGTYILHANNFIYSKINLKEANINGEYRGVPDNIFVNGKGTSFNAPLEYHLRVVDGEAKEIVAHLKEMALSDILALAKQPIYAQGKVDANITLPTLIVDNLEGKGGITFKEVTFDDKLLSEMYEITLPKKTQMQGEIDAIFNGEEIDSIVNIKSTLANLHLPHLKYNTKSQFMTTEYVVDTDNLDNVAKFLHTQLDGKVLLKGHAEQTEIFKITGLTNSLGGEIQYGLIDQNFEASMRGVPVEQLLAFMKFPKFAAGETSGDVNYNLLTKKGGSTVTFGEFKFAPNAMTKSLRVMFKKDPSSIVFGNATLNSEIDGDEILYSFRAKAGDASMEIGKGLVNHKKGTHTAKMKISFKKYSMQGSIGGSLRHPHIGFNVKGFLKEKMLNKGLKNKIKKFVKKVW